MLWVRCVGLKDRDRRVWQLARELARALEDLRPHRPVNNPAQGSPGMCWIPCAFVASSMLGSKLIIIPHIEFQYRGGTGNLLRGAGGGGGEEGWLLGPWKWVLEGSLNREYLTLFALMATASERFKSDA